MVTAWLRSRIPRTRPGAGPLRLLWLTTLLLGLLYTHAVSAESTIDHLGGGQGVVLSAERAQTAPHCGYAAGPGHDHGESGASGVRGALGEGSADPHGTGECRHPSDNCLSLQPEHGDPLPAPPCVPLCHAAPLLACGERCPGVSEDHQAPCSPPRSVRPAVLLI